MSMEGVLQTRDGKQYVLYTYTEFAEPFRQRMWYRVLESHGAGLGERPKDGDVVWSVGSREWRARDAAEGCITGSVRVGAEPEIVERDAVPSPSTGSKQIRWNDGRWEKLMAKGWAPAGEGKPARSSSKKSKAQLDYEIKQVLKRG